MVIIEAMAATDRQNIAGAAALHKEAMHKGGSWSAESIQSLLVSGAELWVAIVDGEVVGMLLFRTIGEESEILTIAVLPEYQGQAVGSYLLHQLEQKHPTGKVFLEVRCDNSPAIALYLKQGFAQISRRKNYYRSGAEKIDALVMAKTLQSIE